MREYADRWCQEVMGDYEDLFFRCGTLSSFLNDFEDLFDDFWMQNGSTNQTVPLRANASAIYAVAALRSEKFKSGSNQGPLGVGSGPSW